MHKGPSYQSLPLVTFLCHCSIWNTTVLELEAGDEIGTVELMTFPLPHCSSGSTNLGSARVQCISPNSSPSNFLNQPSVECSLSDSNREVQLKSQLKLEELQSELITRADMNASKVDQLERVLLDADYVFALDEFELGHTSVVTHRIDTGDHASANQTAVTQDSLLSPRDDLTTCQ